MDNSKALLAVTVPLILGGVLVSSLFGQGERGGRITIKRATDDGATGLGKLAPKKTSIEEILAIVRPDGMRQGQDASRFQTKRVESFETTVWTLEATIKEIIVRPDGDFYMTIEGVTGARTVVEAPDPKLCKDSKLLAQITAVRKILEEKFHPTAQPMKVDVKATLTGVGFFGNASSKSNGARLMPATDVKFTGK